MCSNVIKPLFETIDAKISDDLLIIESVLSNFYSEDIFIPLKTNFFAGFYVISDDVTKQRNYALWKSMWSKSCVYVFVATKIIFFPPGVTKHKNRKVRNANEGERVYVGKSEKALKRIHDHFSDSFDDSSLCLGAHPEWKNSLKMFIFILKCDYSDYKKYILDKMEELMHKKLDPAIGFSRN